MKAGSAKSKGRRLQKWICKQILDRFPQLGPDDVTSRSMGSAGEDVMLSTAARQLVPLSIEAKNQERLSIWAALAQCVANAGDHIPALFFTRNRTPTWAAVPAEHLLDLYKRIAELEALMDLDPEQMEEMATMVAEYIEGGAG